MVKDYKKRVKKLEDRSKELDERERQIEESRKLPFKEKIEYVTLKKLKERVEKITEMIPDGKIKNMLLAVLRGEDIPTPMKQREKAKDRGSMSTRIRDSKKN